MSGPLANRVQVQKYRVSNQPVTVDTNATQGAQVGVNLFNADGSLVKSLSTSSGSSTTTTFNGTSDDVNEGQFNLYFTARRAQDAVGDILADSTNVTLVYVGGTSITANLTTVTPTIGGTLQATLFDSYGRIEKTQAVTWATAGTVALTYTAGTNTVAAALNTTGVTAGTYGSSSQVPQVTFNAEGQATGATNVAITPAAIGAIPTSAEGVANGVATLDSGGKIPSTQLPAIAVNQTYVVNSQAAMLALAADVGDTCVRTDISATFILQALPASTLSNWVELLFPTSGVSSFNGRTGTVNPASGDYTFSMIGSTPTTLSGYGITNGVTNTTQVIAGAGLAGGGALSANVTVSLGTIATGSILGNDSGSTASPSAITIGSGLTMSAGVLSVTGGSSSIDLATLWTSL